MHREPETMYANEKHQSDRTRPSREEGSKVHEATAKTIQNYQEGRFKTNSTRGPGGLRHFAHIKLKSTGQKVAIPAMRKNPTRIMRSPMWCRRWKKPAMPFPRLFLGLALVSSTSVRTGFFLSHTVRRQGGAVFSRIWRRSQREIRLNSARWERARDKSS